MLLPGFDPASKQKFLPWSLMAPEEPLAGRSKSWYCAFGLSLAKQYVLT